MDCDILSISEELNNINPVAWRVSNVSITVSLVLIESWAPAVPVTVISLDPPTTLHCICLLCWILRYLQFDEHTPLNHGNSKGIGFLKPPS